MKSAVTELGSKRRNPTVKLAKELSTAVTALLPITHLSPFQRCSATVCNTSEKSGLHGSGAMTCPLIESWQVNTTPLVNCGVCHKGQPDRLIGSNKHQLLQGANNMPGIARGCSKTLYDAKATSHESVKPVPPDRWSGHVQGNGQCSTAAIVHSRLIMRAHRPPHSVAPAHTQPVHTKALVRAQTAGQCVHHTCMNSSLAAHAGSSPAALRGHAPAGHAAQFAVGSAVRA